MWSPWRETGLVALDDVEDVGRGVERATFCARKLSGLALARRLLLCLSSAGSGFERWSRVGSIVRLRSGVGRRGGAGAGRGVRGCVWLNS